MASVGKKLQCKWKQGSDVMRQGLYFTCNKNQHSFNHGSFFNLRKSIALFSLNTHLENSSEKKFCERDYSSMYKITEKYTMREGHDGRSAQWEKFNSEMRMSECGSVSSTLVSSSSNVPLRSV